MSEAATKALIGIKSSKIDLGSSTLVSTDDLSVSAIFSSGSMIVEKTTSDSCIPSQPSHRHNLARFYRSVQSESGFPADATTNPIRTGDFSKFCDATERDFDRFLDDSLRLRVVCAVDSWE